MATKPKQYEAWPTWVQELYDSWPSTIVARKELKNFSGGAMYGRTEANKESKGEGMAKLALGDRIVAYQKVVVCDTLAQRAFAGSRSHLAKRSKAVA